MDKQKEKVPIWEKACLTIEEASEYSNIGKDKLYEKAKDPDCDFTLKVGVKTLIKKKQFLDYISRTNVL